MSYGVNLGGEYAVLYEKCADCHLFIERNEASGEGVVEFVHLHRGDEADEALDATHEARPSDLIATLETWREFGPPAMRARFGHTGPDFGDISEDQDPDAIAEQVERAYAEAESEIPAWRTNLIAAVWQALDDTSGDIGNVRDQFENAMGSWMP